VLIVFGDEARHFVFLGGCVLALYARPDGAPLRTTADVDCLSRVKPRSLQEKILGDLCTRGILTPDHEVQCRYHVRGSDLVVDILSPEGMNVPPNAWLERAARHAHPYDLGDGQMVMAITPPYFLATKLVAFEDRGPDAQSSKDLEDVVVLAVEVLDLVEQVEAQGLRAEIAELLARALAKYGLIAGDLSDVVDWHLGREDQQHAARVTDVLGRLACVGT
jgi:hypothetical protein